MNGGTVEVTFGGGGLPVLRDLRELRGQSGPLLFALTGPR